MHHVDLRLDALATAQHAPPAFIHRQHLASDPFASPHQIRVERRQLEHVSREASLETPVAHIKAQQCTLLGRDVQQAHTDDGLVVAIVRAPELLICVRRRKYV